MYEQPCFFWALPKENYCTLLVHSLQFNIAVCYQESITILILYNHSCSIVIHLQGWICHLIIIIFTLYKLAIVTWNCLYTLCSTQIARLLFTKCMVFCNTCSYDLLITCLQLLTNKTTDPKDCYSFYCRENCIKSNSS